MRSVLNAPIGLIFTKSMKRVCFSLVAFLFAALVLSGAGQTTSSQTPFAQLPAAERQLIAIKIAGSKRFPEDAIAASTGLHLGTPVTEDDFKKAARHLGESGVFTNIAYSYSYTSAGTKLEFRLTDTTKFVPARFVDFVWFSDDELRRRIKEHVPLFDGELPTSGRMADQVSDVLQSTLVENAIPGHVDYQRVGKEEGPVEAIVFKVSEVLIRIRKIEFTGAVAPELELLEAATQEMPNHEYSRERLNQLVNQKLLPVYHARGYLQASFSPPQPKPVQQPSADAIQEGPRNQTVVDVAFTVTPGQQYKLKALKWAGNKQFPTDTLQKMLHAQTGEPVNTVLLDEDLKDVQKLYASRGFVAAKTKVDATFDDANRTVDLLLQVNEGDLYHMGDLEFRGLDNGLTAKLRNAWKLRPGDVYDANYLDQYLPEARKLLPTNFDWEVSPHVTANLRDKSVDVDLIYSVKAPK
jgi:outer membrane protein assembly factor BamA